MHSSLIAITLLCLQSTWALHIPKCHDYSSCHKVFESSDAPSPRSWHPEPYFASSAGSAAEKKTPGSRAQRLQNYLRPWSTVEHDTETMQDSTPATTWFRNLRKAEKEHGSASASLSSDDEALHPTLTLSPEYLASLKRPVRHDESPYETAARLSRHLDNLKHMLAKDGQDSPSWDTLEQAYTFERLDIHSGMSVALYLLLTFLSVLAVLEIVECCLVARSRRSKQDKKGKQLGRGEIFLESDQEVAFLVCKPRPSTLAWSEEEGFSEKSSVDAIGGVDSESLV